MSQLILASSSPRRKELLQKLIAPLSFECIPAQKEEVFEGEDLKKALGKVARAKAEEVYRLHPESWVLGADTIVVEGGRILGKPGSLKEAEKVLRSLSGNWHEVWTGMALLGPETDLEQIVVTRVHFRNLKDEEIEQYVAKKTCLDKAGSYGIQETDFADALEGSRSNVIGLPVEALSTWLRDLNLLSEGS